MTDKCYTVMFQCWMADDLKAVCKTGWIVAESLESHGAKNISDFKIYNAPVQDVLCNNDITKEVHHFDKVRRYVICIKKL